MNNDLGVTNNLDTFKVTFTDHHGRLPHKGIDPHSDEAFAWPDYTIPFRFMAGVTMDEALALGDTSDGAGVDAGDLRQGRHEGRVRPDWDTYFLNIATAVAARGECTRSQVGAVLVKDHRIRSTGYNGAPRSAPSCLDGACPRAFSDVEPGSSYDTGAGSCIAIHAEANVLLFASKDDCENARLYVTRAPCSGCERLILGSGVGWVITPDEILMNDGASLVAI